MTYYIGQILRFECPGHNGDGRFHRYDATVTDINITDNIITVESEHRGIARYRIAQARSLNEYYLVLV